LPVAAASADAVAALCTLYHYDDPLVPIRDYPDSIGPPALVCGLPVIKI
jgi:hypothetical protein